MIGKDREHASGARGVARDEPVTPDESVTPDDCVTPDECVRRDRHGTARSPAAERSSPRVASLGPSDRDAWGTLYAAYAAFYEVEQTEAMRDRVWSWLMEPSGTQTGGLIGLGAWLPDAAEARTDGDSTSAPRLVGIAHLRPFVRPLAAGTGLYLDDLFVAPEAQGTGSGRALLAAARDLARRDGHGVVRWITARDNEVARALYDREAGATEWVTYDMEP